MRHLAGGGALAALEARLREFYGMRYALALSSATTGLHALTLALDLGRDAFVTTPYTYGATLAGWLLQGACPTFADIDADSLTLEPRAVEATIDGRTRALLAVDIHGMPCDDEALRAIADRRGLWYIADASQSFGAMRGGRSASSRAHALVVSFTAGKALDAGEGGAVLTDDRAVYERLVWFTQHPDRQRAELTGRVWNEFGLNGRMHPSAAALAIERWDGALLRLRARQEWARRVVGVLNASGLVRSISIPADVKPAFFRLTASWAGEPVSRLLTARLSERGIEARVEAAPVTPIYQQAAFLAAYGSRVAARPACPVAEEQARSRFAVVPELRTGTGTE